MVAGPVRCGHRLMPRQFSEGSTLTIANSCASFRQHLSHSSVCGLLLSRHLLNRTAVSLEQLLWLSMAGSTLNKSGAKSAPRRSLSDKLSSLSDRNRRQQPCSTHREQQ